MAKETGQIAAQMAAAPSHVESFPFQLGPFQVETRQRESKPKTATSDVYKRVGTVIARIGASPYGTPLEIMVIFRHKADAVLEVRPLGNFISKLQAVQPINGLSSKETESAQHAWDKFLQTTGEAFKVWYSKQANVPGLAERIAGSSPTSVSL